MVPAAPMTAEISVEMVIRTCEKALATGYNTADAAMCDWQIQPCGVCGPALKPTSEDAWCVPSAVTAMALASTLVNALKRSDPTLPAKPEIAGILRKNFPCAAQDEPSD